LEAGVEPDRIAGPVDARTVRLGDQHSNGSVIEKGHGVLFRCRSCSSLPGPPTRLDPYLRLVILRKSQARPAARVRFEKDVLTPRGPRRPYFQCAGAPCVCNRRRRGRFLFSERLVPTGQRSRSAHRSLERATPPGESGPALRRGRVRRACRQCGTRRAALRSGTPHRRCATRQDCTSDHTRRLRRPPPGRLTESPHPGAKARSITPSGVGPRGLARIRSKEETGECHLRRLPDHCGIIRPLRPYPALRGRHPEADLG
jgi:hypothetical protein